MSNIRASFVVLTVRAETTLVEHFSIFVDIFFNGVVKLLTSEMLTNKQSVH